MGAKSEISWRRRTAAGERVEVYARRVGNEWRFFARAKRHEQWEAVPFPPLEDWLELLDSVERRIQRRLARPEEAGRIRKRIRELFPDVDAQVAGP